MVTSLTNWLFGLFENFANFGTWLTTPFFKGYTPLMFLGLGAVGVLIGVRLYHMFHI